MKCHLQILIIDTYKFNYQMRKRLEAFLTGTSFSCGHQSSRLYQKRIVKKNNI